MKAPKLINNFELYTHKPNTLSKGYYYQQSLFFDTPNEFKNRMIRVYLPSDYDFNNPKKRYPVIYMSDGQNLCDKYLSGYGEWHVDETIETRLKHHQKGFIAVGIDCPYEEKARFLEMRVACKSKYATDDVIEDYSHPLDKGVGHADILANFILKTVKPLIDQTFFTLKNKKNTAVGGSSMGGLMAFYMGMKYKNLIGFSLCFSPAFLCYEERYFMNALRQHKYDVDKYGKFILYTGGKDFEQKFVSTTFGAFNVLKALGFDDNKLRLIYDSNQIHHESAWSIYFPIAISEWLDK